MKADPRGVVLHLRLADKRGETDLADFLTDEIVRHLERLDRMDEAGTYIPHDSEPNRADTPDTEDGAHE